jgi:adenylate cyclase
LAEVTLTTAGPFDVAGYRVEPSTLRVRHEGRDARLEAKAMQVLIYLAEHAGQVVSRAELEEQLWPGRFVTADSVTSAIAKLRRVFGDDAHQPNVIETVPKSGYRLIANVRPIEEAEEDALASLGLAVALKPLRRRPGATWVTVAALALVIGFVAWVLLRPEGTALSPIRALVQQPVVAVLPFENLGADPEQDYFANGITADLITDLSKIKALSVIALGAVFGYEGGISGARQISRDMNLDYVVVGRMQRLGNRLRINVQLIEASGERALWGERYSGSMTDLFDVQDRIASDVISALKVKLSASEQALLADRPTANVVAYDHYLRGMQDHGSRTALQNLSARDHFRRAIELDPAFARAYAGLAMTYSREAIDGWTADPLRALDLAAELAAQAVAMAPNSPQAYFVEGQVELFRGRHARAIAAAERAIEAEPNYADAYALLAWTLNYTGQPEAALSALEQADRQSPRPPASYLEILGEIQFTQGRYRESASTFQRVLEINPGYSRARMWNAAALAATGRIDSAEWEVDELLISSPGVTLARLAYAFPFSDSNKAGTATKRAVLEALRSAGLPE